MCLKLAPIFIIVSEDIGNVYAYLFYLLSMKQKIMKILSDKVPRDVLACDLF